MFEEAAADDKDADDSEIDGSMEVSILSADARRLGLPLPLDADDNEATGVDD